MNNTAKFELKGPEYFFQSSTLSFSCCLMIGHIKTIKIRSYDPLSVSVLLTLIYLRMTSVLNDN